MIILKRLAIIFMMVNCGNLIMLEVSGRIRTDTLNEQCTETALARFEESTAVQGKTNQFQYSMSLRQEQRSLMTFPATGLAVLPILLSSRPFPR